MGFVEKEQKLREQQIIVDQLAVAEKAKFEAAELLRKQQEDEDRSHGPEDNAKIAELLSNLPKFNIREYLDLINRLTGFTGAIYLYTRDENLTRAENLKKLLLERGVDLERSVMHEKDNGDGGTICTFSRLPTVHPSIMFCGLSVRPKFWLSPIKEPKEPGIGIYFSRYSKRMENVFVRLYTPSSIFLTGGGERLTIASFDAFDNAVEYAFTNPHNS